MEPTPPVRLSVSLALEGISEAVTEVERLEVALAEARRVRDDLVADAAQHVSVSRLSRISKLSRQYIYRISPGKIKPGE
jgi:hypothetical protein